MQTLSGGVWRLYDELSTIIPANDDQAMKMCYDAFMRDLPRSTSEKLRLREIATILRRAYALSSADLPAAPGDILVSDMLLALDSPELCDILSEIKALQAEQLQRLERLLSRHADNDM